MVLLGKKTTDDLHTYECVSHSNQFSVEEKVCQMMMNCLEQTSFPFEEREETLFCMGVQLTFCVIEGDKIICLGSNY